jgi:hypothetical protein
MAVFIETETDPFSENMQQQAQQARDPFSAEDDGIRRPIRGLEVKTPTYSYMRVITDSGEMLPFINSASTSGVPNTQTYGNYLIQNLSFNAAEKMQIVQTFGEDYAFFFGQAPIQASVQGALIQSPDFPWSAEMWLNYQNLLRGSRLAERGARLYLYYDGVLLEGLPISFSPTATADQPHLVPFGMAILVTSIEMLYTPSTSFPIRLQTVDFATPEAYQELARRSEAEDRAIAQEYRGSQINQLNKARYQKEKLSYNVQQALGFLMDVATQYSNGPLAMAGTMMGALGLGFSGVQSIDEFLGLEQTTLVARQAPQRVIRLRSRISDNTDEWVVPAMRVVGERFQDRRESLSDADAASAAGVHGDDVQNAGEDVVTDAGSMTFDPSTGEFTDIGTDMGGEAGSIPEFGTSSVSGATLTPPTP